MIRPSPGVSALVKLVLANAMVLIALRSTTSAFGDGKPGAAAAVAVAAQVTHLNELLQAGEADEATLGTSVNDLVNLRAFAKRTFGNYVRRSLEEYEKSVSDAEFQELLARHERRLVGLLQERVVSDLAALIHTSGLTRVELKTRVAKMASSREASIGLRGLTSEGEWIEARLILEQNGSRWHVVDIVYGKRALSERYAREFRDVLKEGYSLPVLASRLKQSEFIQIEDFTTTREGALPEGWYWRDKDKDKPKLFEVRAAGNEHYLAAQDTGLSVVLLKIAHWNPREFPILTWCWRATSLPPGGDESVTETNDGAAGLYVIFRENWFGLPIQIKYVWSTTLPVGTVGRRNMIARPYFFVAQSGDASLDRWEFEQVDLMADHERVFGDKPNTRTLGIGVLTDSNNTHSYAAGDYADIRAWPREALESGAIPDHCACLREDAGLPANHRRDERGWR